MEILIELVDNSKIKKIRKQRNAAVGVAFTEFLLILGLISK